MRVCHKNLLSALLIPDALIKAMEERGLTISALVEKNTVVSVNGERLQVQFKNLWMNGSYDKLTPYDKILELCKNSINTGSE